MKNRADIDFSRTFGDVPPSFSHRVQYALRLTTEEEKPVKKKTFSAIVLAVLLMAIATVGVAATLSKTVEFFQSHYGAASDTVIRMNAGQTDPTPHETLLDGVKFTLHDAVVTDDETCYIGEHNPEAQEAFVPQPTKAFYAVGSISAEDAVLMAWDEYQVTDPAGYALYWGSKYPQPEADSPSYAEVAKARGLDRVRMVNCIGNGILGENGEKYFGTIGSTVIPNVDGTVDFSVEIPGEVVIPEQESYQMSLYIAVQDVDLAGNPIGERIATDWVVTVTPEK